MKVPAFVSPMYIIWWAYSLMPILRRLRNVRVIVDMIGEGSGEEKLSNTQLKVGSTSRLGMSLAIASIAH
jgi:hypothetical protein